MSPSIPIPQVRLGKLKTRSQMWEMFTDDGRIVSLELPVLLSCCDDPAHGKAFLIDTANQYTDERGYWIQVGADRSLMPVCMIEETKILGTVNEPGTHDDDGLLSKLVHQIFHEASESRKELVWLKAGRNTILEKIIWIIAIPCITALVAFALIILKKG